VHSDRDTLRWWTLVLAMISAGFLVIFAYFSVARACGFHRAIRNPLYWQARAAERAGRILEAMDLYRRAARSPSQASRWVSRLWISLARSALRSGRPTLAAAHYRAALRERPHDTVAAVGLLGALRDTGRPREALEEIARLPPVLRTRPSVRSLEARLLADVGDAGGARRVLARLDSEGRATPADRDLAARLGRPTTLASPGSLGDL
jgi:tetratricopeptide (TPR) repeat protein